MNGYGCELFSIEMIITDSLHYDLKEAYEAMSHYQRAEFNKDVLGVLKKEYEAGYDDGENNLDEETESAYDVGYDDGEDSGKKEGIRIAIRKLTNLDSYDEQHIDNIIDFFGALLK